MAVIEGPALPSERLAQSTSRRKQWLRRLRVGSIVIAVLGFWYLATRYQMVELPADRCSPVSAYQPGDQLLVDRKPPVLFVDDTVFFMTPDEALTMGRIVEPPGTPPGTTRLDRGYWIIADGNDCDTPDSQSLGPIAAEALRGRVLFGFTF